MPMHKERVLKLYKSILRLHRGLPTEIQDLGNQYVKDEFRRHKNIAPEHVAPFMMEWINYYTTLAQQIGLRGPKSASRIGKPLEEQQLDAFEAQQLYQLYELKQSIDGDPGKDPPKDKSGS